MSDNEWHGITRYNLIMSQKLVIKLYNIKSISHHYSNLQSLKFLWQTKAKPGEINGKYKYY